MLKGKSGGCQVMQKGTDLKKGEKLVALGPSMAHNEKHKFRLFDNSPFANI
jgi:hypothetical protein